MVRFLCEDEPDKKVMNFLKKGIDSSEHMNYYSGVKSSERMNLKGERRLTEQKRFCIAMPPELEEKVYELRKTDEYCRKSLSEIVRILIQKGLEAEAQTA